MTVSELWGTAARQAGSRTDRRTPSKGLRALLVTLYREGSMHGSELARRTGLLQSNVTPIWLPKLARYGFVESYEIPGMGHQGGGRPAKEWSLTPAGRRLAELIIEEDARG